MRLNVMESTKNNVGKPRFKKPADIQPYLSKVENAAGDGFPMSFLKFQGKALEIFRDREGKHRIEGGMNTANNWVHFLRDMLWGLDRSLKQNDKYDFLDANLKEILLRNGVLQREDLARCTLVVDATRKIAEMMAATERLHAAKVIEKAQVALDLAYQKDSQESAQEIKSYSGMIQSMVAKLLNGSLDLATIRRGRQAFPVNGCEWDEFDRERVNRNDRKLLSKIEAAMAGEDLESETFLLLAGIKQRHHKNLALEKTDRRSKARAKHKKTAANVANRQTSGRLIFEGMEELEEELMP